MHETAGQESKLGFDLYHVHVVRWAQAQTLFPGRTLARRHTPLELSDGFGVPAEHLACHLRALGQCVTRSVERALMTASGS